MTQLKIIPVAEINSAREAYQKMNNEKEIADFRAMAAGFIVKYIIEREYSSFSICTAGHWSEIDIGCNQVGKNRVSDSAAKIALAEFREAGYKTYMKTKKVWLYEDVTEFIVSTRNLNEYSKKSFWRKIELKEIK